MIAECTRHRLPYDPPPPDARSPFYVKRCTHMGNRFVVEFRSSAGRFRAVDYVEDLPNGEMLIEGTDPMDDEQADFCWGTLVAKMRNGISPDKESDW